LQEAVILVQQRRIEKLRSVLTASLHAPGGRGPGIQEKATEDISAAAEIDAAAEISGSEGSPSASDVWADGAVTDQAHSAVDQTASEALEAENRLLRRAVERMRTETHLLRDQADQARSELARTKQHRDLVIGAQLQKHNHLISGYQNGQVLYKQRPETPDQARLRVFGTSDYIGSGPFNGSWIQWGKKPFRPLTHKEVRAHLKFKEAKPGSSFLKAIREEQRRQRALQKGDPAH
jgi:hypothetical protein